MPAQPDAGDAAAAGLGADGGTQIKPDSKIVPQKRIAEVSPSGCTSAVGHKTLYMLSSPATDSWENLASDAERRARERGCQCVRPSFRFVLGGDVCTTFVAHAAWCPLSGMTS